MLGRFSPQKYSQCYQIFSKTLKQTSFQSHASIRKFIWENTETCWQHSLTPELKLRLLTPKCKFWRERPELWPFDDPFWAIYWPGGQALSRYLLDNPDECLGKTVVDVGSGCGASAIAAKLSGAARVVANDTDDVAIIATHMNSELNGLDPPVCVSENMVGSHTEGFDLILLGDMFYDEVLATRLHSWLDRCIKTHGTRVLIGDPGRAQFEGHRIRGLLQQLAQYELPEYVKEENYGLTCSGVWLYQPQV